MKGLVDAFASFYAFSFRILRAVSVSVLASDDLSPTLVLDKSYISTERVPGTFLRRIATSVPDARGGPCGTNPWTPVSRGYISKRSRSATPHVGIFLAESHRCAPGQNRSERGPRGPGAPTTRTPDPRRPPGTVPKPPVRDLGARMAGQWAHRSSKTH